MARRQSKAASRKARQRRVQRPMRTAPSPVSRPVVEEPTSPAESTEEPPRRASAPSAARGFSTGSRLTDRERAEYHYVERDLRNIGILTAVLVGLLLAAWAVFNALGLTG